MGSNHLNHQFGSQESKQHEKYRDNPTLFMKQKWVGYDVECFEHSKIKPRNYQLKAIDSINKNKFNIIASSRQMGGTSMMSIYIAWYVLFNSNKKVMIMSNNLNGGKRILDLIRAIIINFNENILKDNKTEIELSNGCTIKVVAPTLCASKGYMLDLLFIDNAAFINNLSDIYMALGMSMTVGEGKVILMSTPQDDSDFNLLALNGKENESINYIEWSWDKLCGKDWFDKQCVQLGWDQDRIDTELNCVIKYKEKSNKDKTISLRISAETYNKMKIKAGELSASDYIRYLIDHDLS